MRADRATEPSAAGVLKPVSQGRLDDQVAVDLARAERALSCSSDYRTVLAYYDCCRLRLLPQRHLLQGPREWRD